jgi:hypothetical protein
MNSIQEIQTKMLATDPGKAVFSVTRFYDSMMLEIGNWEAKEELRNAAVTPVDIFMVTNLERVFNRETKKMEVKIDNMLSKLQDFIYYVTVDMAEETSPVNQPKRTNAYKDMVLLAKTNCREEAFINDILPIVNYYYKAKTDTNNDEMNMVVHKNNVQALFNVLRKKHGSKKNM